MPQPDSATGAPGHVSGVSSESGEHRPVPVMLITGFLGAGKTSLMNNILTQQHGLRVAVIMNEFGDSVEDASLYTQDSAPVTWTSLANGCMCCKVKAAFVQAMDSLVSQEERAVDYIVVEATGLASPGPVASLLCTEADAGARFQLDSIITVVDCLNINRQLHDLRPEGVLNEAQSQIAYADVILLNKMDLCDEEAITRSEADIRAINSSVPILHTTRCDVELSQVLHRKLFPEALHVIAEGGEEEEEGGIPSHAVVTTPAAVLEAANTASDPEVSTPEKPAAGRSGREEDRDSMKDSNSWFNEEGLSSSSNRALRHNKSRSRSVSRSRRRSLTMDSEHGQDSLHTLHDPEITAVVVSTNKALELDRVKAFLDKLLWNREVHPHDIYRVKGVLSVAGSDSKHLLQAVYEAYELLPTAVEWGASEERGCKVVVIGRSLKQAVIQEWFAECEA